MLILLILIALVLVAMMLCKQLMKERGPNRYKRKATKRTEPRLSESLDDASEGVDDQDSDAILGIKPCKTVSLHETQVVQPKKKTVIVINLLAKYGSTFGGYDLLQAVLSQGLRFGAMKIFHRHTHKNGRGDVLFSMASLEEPGTFDLPTMSEFTTSGLSFFLQVDAVSDPHTALDVLVDVVSNLRDELGGDLFDSNKQPVNKDSIAAFYRLIDQTISDEVVSVVES